MFKLFTAFVLVTLVCCALGAPQVPANSEIASAVAAGNFEEASRLLKKHYETSIKSYQPPAVNQNKDGKKAGEYFFQSEASYRSVVNNNGKVQEDQGGLGVVDNNGAVTYYKPASVTSE